MELTRDYYNTFFPWSVVRDGTLGFTTTTSNWWKAQEFLGEPFFEEMRIVCRGTDTWTFDSDDEFAEEYGTPANLPSFCSFQLQSTKWSLRLRHTFGGVEQKSSVTVRAPTRTQVLKVLRPFDDAQDAARLPEKSPGAIRPVVFLGHGRSPQWRDLKDHLTDKQGVQVDAYEVGARAGHSVRDILGSMLDRSSIAFLVLTAEDVAGSDSDKMRARQNVVHELGLFQGKLGFERGIALVEDGVEMFSNLDGIEQIRFPTGGIKATFGDVLATIRREFP